MKFYGSTFSCFYTMQWKTELHTLKQNVLCNITAICLPISLMKLKEPKKKKKSKLSLKIFCTIK